MGTAEMKTCHESNHNYLGHKVRGEMITREPVGPRDNVQICRDTKDRGYFLRVKGPKGYICSQGLFPRFTGMKDRAHKFFPLAKAVLRGK